MPKSVGRDVDDVRLLYLARRVLTTRNYLLREILR
ncbi:hypothetical protein COLO4_02439 [Corchorus olitorius]|uniref:Uncharacterized protein n=1 Tax=Corchorus olitorius TaxID=93759 RepID=A0A1R3L131_9ROSI|nr:hypothetical protein COLO4_02439 [Corchorus olitorius]